MASISINATSTLNELPSGDGRLALDGDKTEMPLMTRYHSLLCPTRLGVTADTPV